MGPCPYYSRSKVVYAYQVLDVFFWSNTIFGYFTLPWQPISEIFSPCFKLGQNLSLFQFLEKSTHSFGQNDSTNIQTDTQIDRHTDICFYIYIGDIYVSGLISTEVVRHLPQW